MKWRDLDSWRPGKKWEGFLSPKEDRVRSLGVLNIPKIKIWRRKACMGKGGAVQILSQGKTSNLLQEMSKRYTSLKNKVFWFSFLLFKNHLKLAFLFHTGTWCIWFIYCISKRRADFRVCAVWWKNFWKFESLALTADEAKEKQLCVCAGGGGRNEYWQQRRSAVS